ncbi:hypothetical protein LTR86_009587 [Recurvomyces mirabilis]|nr:hypothetical protein LTR86_009587 [Recurvomyces mirabilis]
MSAPSTRVFNTGGPFLTRTIWSSQAPYRCYQRRWAQVHDVRFVASRNSSTNPSAVQEKYRAKLEQKAREKGLRNVEELKGEYEVRIRELREKATVPGANAPVSAQVPPRPEGIDAAVPYQVPPVPKEGGGDGGAAQDYAKASKDGVKTLSSFIDVQKTSELPSKEIEALWRLRHVRDSQSLCAVMPASTFTRIATTARKHPQFILPLPREGQGAEIHFLQWTFPSKNTATVLFTHLAEFKLRGEFAQPHTTVTHHLDLAGSNDIVLLEGRVTEDKALSVDEGKWLLMCLQKFYGFEAHSEGAKQNAARRRKLMEQFSGGDETFKVEELVEEAEKVP